MSFGVDQARRRILDAMKAGKWDVVEAHITAYGAAIRAEERHRAIGEAIEALKECGGDEGETPARDCLAELERLR